MKKNVLFLSVIASAAFLAACSSDELVDDTNNPVIGQEVEHITVTLPDMEIVSFDDAETRAEFTYRNNAFSFGWSSGDVLGVFPNKGAQVDFPIDEKYVGTASAEFDGGGWALKTGYTYAVYYPYDYYNRDKTALPMNYVGQTQKAANDYSHLNNFNYFASNEAITADGPSLDFKVGYMGTIVYMPFTLPVDATLTEIRLISSDTPFITQANLDISGRIPTFKPAMVSQSVSLKLNNIAVKAGEESNFYMWILPRDFTGSKMTAEIVTSTGDIYETVLFPSGYDVNKSQGKFMRFQRPNDNYKITYKGTVNKAIAAMNDLYVAFNKPATLSDWTLDATSEADFKGVGVTVEDGHITAINLSGMGLTGTIPESIGNLTNLKRLELDDNEHLSGSIPESIGNLTNLEYLNLGENSLDGSIPESIGNLTNLEYLNLGGNSLDGSIPESIGDLTNLEYLGLSGNSLDGSIPESIGNLTNLAHLYLSVNRLSGELPSTLGNLKQLKSLSLYSNSLSGVLPLWVGNLQDLQYLDLEDNDFTGDFAKWFFNDLPELPLLDTLYVNGNKLTGTITREMQESTRWKNLNEKYVEPQQEGWAIVIEEDTVSASNASIEDFTETNYGW